MGIEARIYTLKSATGMKELESAYRKYSGKPGTDKKLGDKFNSKGDSLLLVTDGKWFAGR